MTVKSSRCSWLFCVAPRCTVADVLIGIGMAGILLAIAFALYGDRGQPPGSVAGGEGTADDPYRLATCEELQRVSVAPAASYVLLQDIDCSASRDWNGGAGFFPVGYYQYGFSGTLDGAGHAIRDLVLRRPSTDYVGLFGKLDAGSTVRNLTLEVDVEGKDDVGGLAGWAMGGTVESVIVRGRVRGRTGVGGLLGVNQGAVRDAHGGADVAGAGKWVGGLVGWNYTGASVDDSSAAGSVHGAAYVGGLVGVNHGASIRKSFAAGSVDGTEVVGGLVGYLVGNGDTAGVVLDSYTSGLVNGAPEGPLIGRRDNAAVVRGCFVASPQAEIVR